MGFEGNNVSNIHLMSNISTLFIWNYLIYLYTKELRSIIKKEYKLIYLFSLVNLYSCTTIGNLTSYSEILTVKLISFKITKL